MQAGVPERHADIRHSSHRLWADLPPPLTAAGIAGSGDARPGTVLIRASRICSHTGSDPAREPPVQIVTVGRGSRPTPHPPRVVATTPSSRTDRSPAARGPAHQTTPALPGGPCQGSPRTAAGPPAEAPHQRL
jgi:hypothetical protein